MKNIALALLLSCVFAAMAQAAPAMNKVAAGELSEDVFNLKTPNMFANKGAVIPNITNGYSGNAPDLGALELDGPLPHYGPRS